ncbi:MAG TPA: DUF2073 domain-containing protein [Thermoplasmatales archaeon]|nr:DUF2073 domain-containing protein [Thermoplasmatales archaeon]
MVKRQRKSISINLVSKQKLDKLSSQEKLDFILREIRQGKVLVLEQGLTPLEQTALIEKTMKEIEEDAFIGIEMDGYLAEDKATLFKRLFGVIRKPGLTVIGPADLIKTIRKDENIIQTEILAERGV